MGHPRLSDECKTELWERYARGETAAVIARAVGRLDEVTREGAAAIVTQTTELTHT